MQNNVTLPLGSISLIDKIEKEIGLISGIFGNAGGKSKNFLGIAKLLLCNRLEDTVSIHQIAPTSTKEKFELLGINGEEVETIERSLYRAIQTIGREFPILLERYQNILKPRGLLDKDQNIDFSSSYFEGKKAELGAHGYSRDKRPDRPQVTWGIATGISGIPSALTIQKGNVQDKTHMHEMLRISTRILEPGSLLIFDCGANTPTVKDKIQNNGFNYLTLKVKKVGTYRRHIKDFEKECKKIRTGDKENEKEYLAVKRKSDKRDGEFFYIFFSKELCEDQLRKKASKFEKRKQKGDKLLKKAKNHKAVQMFPSKEGWIGLYPEIQNTLVDIENPYITGIEGFFILESSVDTDPKSILEIYKQRDVAEKLIRNMKEGGELRPIRHWNKYSIIGSLFICFLATALINLTLKLCKNPDVKNFKLLKKYLGSLTLTVIYPENGFRIRVVSNFLPPIRSLLDDFPLKYGDKRFNLW
jgi:transposase